MKNLLKKVSFVVLSIGIITSNVSTVLSQNETTASEPVALDAIYDPKNYEDEFADDTVIVVMKPSTYNDGSASIASVEGTGAFGDLSINNVENLNPCRTRLREKAATYVANTEEQEIIGDVLSLTLTETGREAVLAAIEELKNNENVLYSFPNYRITLDDVEEESSEEYISPMSITPNDTYFSNLWGLNKINAPSAWDYSTGSSVVTVGVVDTGVDFNHEDLMNNVWTNENEIPKNGIDDDDNGYIDDVCGWDFYNDDNKPEDNNSHGTHVAGTISAKGNNSKGITGVAWNIKLAGLKFMDVNSEGETGGYYSDALKAFDYAEAMGIDITNNSWTLTNHLSHLLPLMGTTYTHLCVAAAGNDGSDISGDYSSYDRSNIIIVANTTSSDALSSSSNYGSNIVDIAAPGSSIYSCVPNDGYGYKSGTSMASPHVAGAAALLKSYNQSLTPAQIKTQIISGADSVSALNGKVICGGRLNVYNLFN